MATFSVFRRIQFFLEEKPNYCCGLASRLSTRLLPYIRLLTASSCPGLPCLRFFLLFLVFEDLVTSQSLDSSLPEITSKVKALVSLLQERAPSPRCSWSIFLPSLIKQSRIFSSCCLLHLLLAVVRKLSKCGTRPCGTASIPSF